MILFFLVNLAFAWQGTNVSAQMFGERMVGGQGTLRGNERFLRGNRSRRDFVGTDRRELTGFVGAQQAIGTGRVQSATEGLRIDAVNPRRVNRPLAPIPRRGMYYPRLVVDLDPSSIRVDSMNADAELRDSISSARLADRIGRLAGPTVELTVSQNTAFLSGTVDSQRSAELVEQILEFEPGIDRVVNELEIRRQF
jgi:hypothetical protein